MIIGISGVARSGKDSVANILVKNYGFKKMAFADPLKRICSKVFLVPIQCFYDDNMKDMALIEPEVIDVYHIQRLVTELAEHVNITADQVQSLNTHGCGKELKSPREILQFVGTDLVRTHIKDTVWLDIFISELKKSDGHVVCSDARFENERKILKELGGINILVTRPTITAAAQAHSSETNLGTEADYDVVVKNEGSLADLHHDITMWYTLKHVR